MQAHVCMPCSGDATETRGKRMGWETRRLGSLAAPSRMMRERVGPREGVDWCVSGAGIQ